MSRFFLQSHPKIVGPLQGVLPALALMLVLLQGCGSKETEQERHRDANTPAGKVGQAAHKVAVEAGNAGRVIGRKLDKAAHDAHEGWKEDSQKRRKMDDKK